MPSENVFAEPTLETIAAQVAGRHQPKVLVLDSLDPATAVQDASPLIAACGAIGWSGAHALSDQDILEWDPDVVILLADTNGMDDAEDDLKDLEEWMPTSAARGGDCYCAVRETFESKPRVLATILHPDLFTWMLPPHSVRIAIPKERVPEEDDDNQGVETECDSESSASSAG